MKQKHLIILLFLIFIFTLLVIGCSSDNTTTTGTNTNQQTGGKEINRKKIVESLIKSFNNQDTNIAESSLLNLKALMQDKKMRFVAIEALVHNLTNTDNKIRMRCIEALKREDMPPRVKSELEKMIDTEKTQPVLIAIFEALTLVGDKTTIEKLTKIANATKDEVIKEFAQSAIRNIEKRLKKGGK